MEESDVTELIDRINRLCDSIAASVQDCANTDHLWRIANSLECVYMAGHDDVDYDAEFHDRPPDA